MSNSEQDLFSQQELNQIKQKLLNELDELTSRSEETVGNLQKLTKNKFSDPGDRAYLESERSINLRISDRERKLRGKINKILKRIENNEYQNCVECGELINKNRLLSRPVTDLCIDCKEKQEQNERNKNL